MNEQIDLDKVLKYAIDKKIKIKDSVFMTNSTKLYLYNIYDDLIRFAKENSNGRSE